MKPQTIATLEELENADWFNQVGIEDGDSTIPTIFLSSWQEAIEHCSSLEWENLCLEAANQYRERLVERSKEISLGRFVSKDGMRQVRYGHHEANSPRHHGHFEAYNNSYYQGGKVIETSTVRILSD